MKRLRFLITLSLLLVALCGCQKEEASDELVLRICSWEEYIDEGDWDEEDAIELSEDKVIIGENSMVEDFEEWYYETYGEKIRVEYSTVGTNEDLYNQMTLGDTFDLVCPSEYMIMKLIAEDELVPFSEEFYNKDAEHNYYAKGVSPYIEEVLSDLNIDGKILADYAAGYMWGTLGIVYNPEERSIQIAGMVGWLLIAVGYDF